MACLASGSGDLGCLGSDNLPFAAGFHPSVGFTIFARYILTVVLEAFASKGVGGDCRVSVGTHFEVIQGDRGRGEIVAPYVFYVLGLVGYRATPPGVDDVGRFNTLDDGRITAYEALIPLLL